MSTAYRHTSARTIDEEQVDNEKFPKAMGYRSRQETIRQARAAGARFIGCYTEHHGAQTVSHYRWSTAGEFPKAIHVP